MILHLEAPKKYSNLNLKRKNDSSGELATIYRQTQPVVKGRRWHRFTFLHVQLHADNKTDLVFILLSQLYRLCPKWLLNDKVPVNEAGLPHIKVSNNHHFWHFLSIPPLKKTFFFFLQQWDINVLMWCSSKAKNDALTQRWETHGWCLAALSLQAALAWMSQSFFSCREASGV